MGNFSHLITFMSSSSMNTSIKRNVFAWWCQLCRLRSYVHGGREPRFFLCRLHSMSGEGMEVSIPDELSVGRGPCGRLNFHWAPPSNILSISTNWCTSSIHDWFRPATKNKSTLPPKLDVAWWVIVFRREWHWLFKDGSGTVWIGLEEQSEWNTLRLASSQRFMYCNRAA